MAIRSPRLLKLIDWIPSVSPELDAFDHLAPLISVFERSISEPVRVVVNVPPQHGKSTAAFHWLSWANLVKPASTLYVTYSSDFATSQMRRAKRIAERAKLPFASDSRSLCEWSLTNGGSLWATGAGASITGRPGERVIVDDPIRGWVEAQSQKIRDNTHDWLRSEVLTRLHPSSPVIMISTRWHEDDVAGRLIRDGWEHINLPAINDQGLALWDKRPLEWLEEQRSSRGVGEFVFSSLYQGQPIPRGNALFGPPTYSEPSEGPLVHAIGVDLAYTAKTSSDYSVAVVLSRDHRGHMRVADVVRKQVKAPEFALTLKALSSKYPGAPIRWYAHGVELGSADFLIKQGIPIKPIPATKDKFVRAQKTAAAWNEGKISIDADAPWAFDFLREVQAFTGVNDAHDDLVDSLASAYDELALWSPDAGKIDVVRARTSAGLRRYY